MEKRMGMTPQKAAEIFPANNDKPLKRARLQRGLSQSELAAAAGISIQAVRAYEQGGRDINGASIDTLCAICDALGCKIGDIIDDALKARFDKVK